MGYVYMIENKINNKKYIGKTNNCPKKRWSEHKKSMTRKAHMARPLYRAMRKYGIENFEFTILCETDNPEDCEVNLIKQYDTYRNGYNATVGGDGKPWQLHRVDEVLELYVLDFGICKIAHILKMDNKTVTNIISNNVDKFRNVNYTGKIKNYSYKPVVMMSKDTGEELMWFDSASEAQRFISGTCDDKDSHISCVCNGKRKTSLGYKWKWKE